MQNKINAKNGKYMDSMFRKVGDDLVYQQLICILFFFIKDKNKIRNKNTDYVLISALN